MNLRCECGYQLDGLHASRPCPECGRHRLIAYDHLGLSSLSRESVPVIMRCLVVHGFATFSFMMVGTWLLMFLVGDVWSIWSMALVGFLVAASMLLRSSERLVDPELREDPTVRRWRLFTRISCLLLLFCALLSTVLVARITSGPNGLTAPGSLPKGVSIWLFVTQILSLVVSLCGVNASKKLSSWAGEDRSLVFYGTGNWLLAGWYVLMVIGLLIFVFGSSQMNMRHSWSELLLGGWGLDALKVVTFLMLTGWWLMAMAGDLVLFWSLVLCIGHSIQFREIEERRRERG